MSRILVAASIRGLIGHVKRALASADFEVESCPLEREAVRQALKQPREMCIVDAEDDENEIRWLLETLCNNHPSTVPLLLSRDYRNPFILDLIAKEQLNNLIASHSDLSSSTALIDENELIVTCHKLCGNDIFGIEKYLPTCTIKVHNLEIGGTESKARAIDELSRFLDRIDCHGAIRSSVLLVADELLMNAIFSAPRDVVGGRKYADADRREPVALAPEERPTFRFACDGRNIVLSVADRFGSLDRSVIVRYLQRCFSERPVGSMEEKAGGAGLGLFLVFNSITQLTFNIHVGVATEVIASFYVRRGARAFTLSGHSLNIFYVRS